MRGIGKFSVLITGAVGIGETLIPSFHQTSNHWQWLRGEFSLPEPNWLLSYNIGGGGGGNTQHAVVVQWEFLQLICQVLSQICFFDNSTQLAVMMIQEEEEENTKICCCAAMPIFAIYLGQILYLIFVHSIDTLTRTSNVNSELIYSYTQLECRRLFILNQFMHSSPKDDL